MKIVKMLLPADTDLLNSATEEFRLEKAKLLKICLFVIYRGFVIYRLFCKQFSVLKKWYFQQFQLEHCLGSI